MPGLYPMKWMLSTRRAVKNYEAAVAPYHQVLVKLKLPKRGPAGAAVNYERVALVATAMARRKAER